LLFCWLFCQISIRTECDKLIVALLDGKNDVYYKGIAALNRKKDMKRLKDELRIKGVDI